MKINVNYLTMEYVHCIFGMLMLMIVSTEEYGFKRGSYYMFKAWRNYLDTKLEKEWRRHGSAISIKNNIKTLASDN